MSYYDDNEDRLTGGRLEIDDLMFTRPAPAELHYHRTRDGQRMLIAEMDDEHLKNTLRLFVRILESSVDAMGASQNPIESILYEMDKEAAERFIRGFQVVFPQYVFEAAVRDMDISGIMDTVRSLLNRSDRLPNRSIRRISGGDDV